MKFNLKYSLILFALNSVAHAECVNPFEANRFLLQGKLNCEGITEQTTLRIGKPSEANSYHDISPTSYFVKPVCIDKAKSLYLDYNSEENQLIVNGEASKNGEIIFVRPSCHGNIVLSIMQTYNRFLPGDKINVSYTNQCTGMDPCFEYVLQSENFDDEVTLRNYNGTVVAHAKKTRVDGTTCFTNWDVNYTETDPTIISLILTLKANAKLNCTPQPSPGGMTPGEIGVISSLSVIVGAVVFGIVLKNYIAHVHEPYEEIQ